MAKAIVEGKVKSAVPDLGKLVRLEEFLREERWAGEQTKLVIEWGDAGGSDEGQDEEAG